MAKRQPRATAAEFGPLDLSSTALYVGEGWGVGIIEDVEGWEVGNIEDGEGDSERLGWVGSTVLKMHNIMYCIPHKHT